MLKSFLLVLVLLVFVSCNNAEQNRLVDLVKEWKQHTILFPENPVFTIQGKDTVAFPLENSLKIVSYVDSAGCTNCKLRLRDWTEFIAYMDVNMPTKVPVYLFIHSQKVKNVKYLLECENFVYPVCLDLDNEFYEMNKFPDDTTFQTFLLDKDNKVLAIGNPVHNPKVKELYLKIIQGGKIGEEDKEKLIRTTVSIDQTLVSLGTFDWHQPQTATFTLKNVGGKPLVIEGVSTSCGCTTVDYPQEPVQPGKELLLTVTYKADKPEHFNKTITMYCNAETSPVKLTISGDAE